MTKCSALLPVGPGTLDRNCSTASCCEWNSCAYTCSGRVRGRGGGTAGAHHQQGLHHGEGAGPLQLGQHGLQQQVQVVPEHGGADLLDERGDQPTHEGGGELGPDGVEEVLRHGDDVDDTRLALSQGDLNAFSRSRLKESSHCLILNHTWLSVKEATCCGATEM